MTYDVPVKLFSFHLIVMSAFLVAPNAPRLFDFFIRRRAASACAPSRRSAGARAGARAVRRRASSSYAAWVVALPCRQQRRVVERVRRRRAEVAALRHLDRRTDDRRRAAAPRAGDRLDSVEARHLPAPDQRDLPTHERLVRQLRGRRSTRSQKTLTLTAFDSAQDGLAARLPATDEGSLAARRNTRRTRGAHGAVVSRSRLVPPAQPRLPLDLGSAIQPLTLLESPRACLTPSSSVRDRTVSPPRSRSRAPALRARLRGRVDDRRRHALGGADAARLRARRLLDRARVDARVAVSQERCRSPTSGSSSRIPAAPFAHPLDDGTAVVVRSLDRRDRRRPVAPRTRDRIAALVEPFVDRADDLMHGAARAARLAPSAADGALRPTRHSIGRRIGALALSPTSARARCSPASPRTAWCRSINCRRRATALALIVAAHAGGWPVARGGSQRVADAMAAYLRSLGGEIVTGMRVESLAALPPARAVLCDVTPRQFMRMAGDRLPSGYRKRLDRYRYGPGVFKMDWALSEPVPWRSKACARRRHGSPRRHAWTRSRSANARRGVDDTSSDRTCSPCKPTVCDDTRAPAGKHTLWAYCHVPHGSTVDMTQRIERQIERFAPGFRDCIEAKSVMFPADMERRQRQSDRRRHRRRRGAISRSSSRGPVAEPRSIPDGDRRRVSLLVVDAAGHRRTWHVRILRRAIRAPRSLAHAFFGCS